MKLETYIKESALDRNTFAAKLGVTVMCINNWVAGKRIPRKEQMEAINSATDGAVTANDFYNFPEQSNSVAPASGSKGAE